MKSAPLFSRLSNWVARATGRPITFLLAGTTVLVWLITGPAFHFSDTWQLVMNTTSSIVTFLMVFIIQDTQNRDSEATQLKLDELIRAVSGAHVTLLDLEDLTVDELDRVKKAYVELARQAKADMVSGQQDTGTPDLPWTC